MNVIVRKEDLLFVYRNALGYVNQHSYPKGERAGYRNDLIRRMELWMISANDTGATECEKQKLLAEGKKIYKDYCAFAKGHPEENTEQLMQRVDLIIELLSEIEVKSISLYRINIEENQFLDVHRIFSEKQYVREFLNCSITTVLEHAIANKGLGAIRECHQYYMSDYGKKYHLKECRYCKGRKLNLFSEKQYMELGIGPCNCVIQANEKERRILKRKKEHECITAFVDESIRLNPGYQIDNSQDQYQNLIGVVMCKGKIKNEANITKGNTLAQFVRVGDRTPKTGETAMEAIGQVLIKAASMGYRERVLIYTDNQKAATDWRDNIVLGTLANMYESVSVCQIDRNSNKYADGLIRRNDIMVLPKHKMKDIVNFYINGREE